jgi:hypothetical protein
LDRQFVQDLEWLLRATSSPSQEAELRISDSEEDVIVSFMQILTDGFTSTLRPNAVTA